MKDSTILKVIAGIVTGAGAIELIAMGYVEAGAALLGMMVGFFVREGVDKVQAKTTD